MNKSSFTLLLVSAFWSLRSRWMCDNARASVHSSFLLLTPSEYRQLSCPHSFCEPAHSLDSSVSFSTHVVTVKCGWLSRFDLQPRETLPRKSRDLCLTIVVIQRVLGSMVSCSGER
ncbi:hypothetical protein TcasGA2_TC034600 [Tribolium castaneum]|uniref:Secreted protein n=1 Tax=Tribolium castaneum TaxID=7070 RepID=A0A139WKR6_TRICA|nr:hypothetical protein TcasGA2_TC034600 [Tribolium castaneum]